MSTWQVLSSMYLEKVFLDHGDKMTCKFAKWALGSTDFTTWPIGACLLPI